MVGISIVGNINFIIGHKLINFIFITVYIPLIKHTFLNITEFYTI